MKIVALLASPRKQSNSAALASAFLERAAQLGAQTSAHRLNQLSYRGCQACYQCKTKLDICVLKDDLTPVLADLALADIWVLAAPIYFGQLAGQLKLAMDRWFSFLSSDYLTNDRPFRPGPGKQSVWCLTQGAQAELFDQVFPQYEPFMLRYGFKANHLLRAPGTGPGRQDPIDPARLDEARALAERLLA
ncbi:MAG: flavodoxin family protein [Pseudomonadota bacterium]